jgi:hypothetical protein
MADTRKRRLVPYWTPPENVISDERQALVYEFVHELRRGQDLTDAQLAIRLLTRVDLRGWKPTRRDVHPWQRSPATEQGAADGIAAARAALKRGTQGLSE